MFDPAALGLVVHQLPFGAVAGAVVEHAGILRAQPAGETHLLGVVDGELGALHRRTRDRAAPAGAHVEGFDAGVGVVVEGPDFDQHGVRVVGDRVDHVGRHVLLVASLDARTGAAAFGAEPDQVLDVLAVGVHGVDLARGAGFVVGTKGLGHAQHQAVVADPGEVADVGVLAQRETRRHRIVGAPEHDQPGAVTQRHGGGIELPGGGNLDVGEAVELGEGGDIHLRGRGGSRQRGGEQQPGGDE